jgi:hypothetical protein
MPNSPDDYIRITVSEMKEQTDASYWGGVASGAIGMLLAVIVVYVAFG